MKITVTSDDGTFKQDVDCTDIDPAGHTMNWVILGLRFRSAVNNCCHAENPANPTSDEKHTIP